MSKACVCTGPHGNVCSLNTIRLEMFQGEVDTGHKQVLQEESRRKKTRHVEVDVWAGRLIVFVENIPSWQFIVFGGPERTVPLVQHPAHPTIPGCYVLDAPEAHRSGSWPDAVVPTGAFLKRSEDQLVATYREMDGTERSVRLSNTRWYKESLEKIVAQNEGRRSRELVELDVLSTIMGAYDDCWEGDPRFAGDPEHVATPKYSYNPFGPWSFRLLRKKDGWKEQHLHTTATSFDDYLERRRGPTKRKKPDWRMREPWESLGMSHGCIHIDWGDLKTMIAKGWAKKGRVLLIHEWGRKGPPVPEKKTI